MKNRRLGSAGPDISVVGYGAWEASAHWGNDFDDAGIIATIQTAVDAGINWIDTAEAYGPYTSEEIVGRAIDGLDHVRVATKVAPTVGGFRLDQIRAAAEGSLTRLKRPVIDLYQLHWPAGHVPVEESWEAMCSLQDDGLVGAIGVSNFDEKLIGRCESIRHVDSIQPQLSILHRRNAKLIEFCAERGIGVVAYGPLAYGLLTGSISRRTTFDVGDWRGGQRGFDLYDRFFAPEAMDRHLAVVDSLRPISERAGVSLADLAIAWVVAQSGVTSAIVGSRNPAHVQANARAADLVLDADTIAAVDALMSS
jgi:aryl-alcohol dehydrogenase-like predicted oxidoreductase